MQSKIKENYTPKLPIKPINSYNNKQQTTTKNNHTGVQKGTGYMPHRAQVNVPKRTGSNLLKRKSSNKITKEEIKSISKDNRNNLREEGKEIEIGQETEQDSKELRKEGYKKVRKEGGLVDKRGRPKGKKKNILLLDYRTWIIEYDNSGFPSTSFNLKKKGSKHTAYCSTLESALKILYNEMLADYVNRQNNYGAKFNDLADAIKASKNEIISILGVNGLEKFLKNDRNKNRGGGEIIRWDNKQNGKKPFYFNICLFVHFLYRNWTKNRDLVTSLYSVFVKCLFCGVNWTYV